ncbi:MAG: hypothetical protein ACJ79Q_00615 [Gemmatimonadaceae bacterium]|jgi:hypothetical protein
MKARLVLLATMSVVVGLAACGDPTNVTANVPTSVDTLSVFALSGSPPSYPSGIAIVSRQPVKVDGFANFDIAFDIAPNGDAIIYPVKLVVSSPGGSRPVGLQKVAGTFDQVSTAPKDGYQTDTAVVLAPGETATIKSPHNTVGDICQFAIDANIFAKVAVDSVNLATRRMYLRLGLDPNCGFRSFAEGIPKT